jgi:phosphoglycolate phosphatase
MKMILFDIDGTLLHTGGCGRIAFEKAFEDLFGVEDSWGDLIPDGKTDPVIIEEITARILKRSLNDSEYETLCERYHFYFRIEIQNPPQFRLMPGVERLLKALAEEPALFLGVATGNFEEAAWMKLERGNLKSFFKFGGFASDSADRTELTAEALRRGEKIMGRKAERHSVFLIGDTPFDVAVGKKLGLQTIGVATGRTGCEEFLRLGAQYALKNLEDTDGFLKLLQDTRS